MKTSCFVEYSGKQLDQNELIVRIKDLWTNDGNKIKDIKSLNLYIKPEESTAYYVINNSYTGSFQM
jgi:hypothetical protein